MTTYTVQTAPGVLHAKLTGDAAASLLKASTRIELEWAIEEEGVCSTIDDHGKDIVAVAASDEWRLR
jgi:hypothetical protein